MDNDTHLFGGFLEAGLSFWADVPGWGTPLSGTTFDPVRLTENSVA